MAFELLLELLFGTVITSTLILGFLELDVFQKTPTRYSNTTP